MVWPLAILAVLASGCDLVLSLDRSGETPPDTVPRITCPDTYDAIDSGFYRVVADSTRPWLDAEHDCESDSLSTAITGFTHLVVLSNDTERQKVGALAQLQADAYVGLSDRKADSIFLWVSKEGSTYGQVLLFPPWATGQPDGNGDCVVMRNDNSFDDVDCSVGRQYICECDQFDVETIAF